MKNLAASIIVFLGGFIIMVLEIIGARYLPIYFGSAFEIWVSQIGLILVALAVGYYLGGALADRWRRLSHLSWLLFLAGIYTMAIPNFSGWWLDLIVNRHPLNEEIPPIWVKLDPVLGSAVVFLLPCVVLAMLSPYMIVLATRSIDRVGHASGLIFAASTVGSIAGVFLAGFVLIEYMGLSTIFRVIGGVTIFLGFLCLALDRLLSPPAQLPGLQPRP